MLEICTVSHCQVLKTEPLVSGVYMHAFILCCFPMCIVS